MHYHEPGAQQCINLAWYRRNPRIGKGTGQDSPGT